MLGPAMPGAAAAKADTIAECGLGDAEKILLARFNTFIPLKQHRVSTLHFFHYLVNANRLSCKRKDKYWRNWYSNTCYKCPSTVWYCSPKAKKRGCNIRKKKKKPLLRFQQYYIYNVLISVLPKWKWEAEISRGHIFPFRPHVHTYTNTHHTPTSICLAPNRRQTLLHLPAVATSTY